MWFDFAAECAHDYANNHRRYAWVSYERCNGRPTIEDCTIDACGWVVYAMWLRTQSCDTAFSAWEGTYHLALIDGGSLIQTYTLSEDEFQDYPGMPVNWWIPF
jgi:hypothetical protein